MKKTENRKQKSGNRRNRAAAFLLICLFPFALSLSVHAASDQPDLNSPGFKLSVCDGPAEANLNHDPNYKVCDFNGVMNQVKYIINVAIVAGVLIAVVGFTYAGILHITGTQENLKKARSIFPKIGIGFIIMLTAWSVVYMLLTWLTNNNAYKSLLGG